MLDDYMGHAERRCARAAASKTLKSKRNLAQLLMGALLAWRESIFDPKLNIVKVLLDIHGGQEH